MKKGRRENEKSNNEGIYKALFQPRPKSPGRGSKYGELFFFLSGVMWEWGD
jgi:hypothetical protein